ncbi:uncharacterized protein LOC135396094 isoform X1 [Ornithodoros turicata]|uniref:uncharacterized protein LOC135396094 isoform X1 n=1 Tax=Ornithodoros turicata TaxID=34597 RepID=UPI003138B2C7
MKYMTTCCCSCCTVETGTKILSILGAISFIIGFCSSITQTVFNNENNPFDLREIAVSQAVFCAIGALLAVLCMMGAVKKQRHLIFPYLVFQGIYMAYMVVFSTFLILAMGALGVSHHDAVGNDPKTMDSQTDSSRAMYAYMAISVTVSVVVYFILNLYYFFVILSYYKALEKAECYNQFQMGDRLMSSDEPPPYSPEDKPTQHCP